MVCGIMKYCIEKGSIALDGISLTIFFVDNGSVATEVYRLLAEDNDCVIHPLGTRGPSGGKHEGRGSWTFARYLADTDYAGKTNAFWDKIKGRLDEDDCHTVSSKPVQVRVHHKLKD